MKINEEDKKIISVKVESIDAHCNAYWSGRTISGRDHSFIAAVRHEDFARMEVEITGWDSDEVRLTVYHERPETDEEYLKRKEEEDRRSKAAKKGWEKRRANEKEHEDAEYERYLELKNKFEK